MSPARKGDVITGSKGPVDIDEDEPNEPQQGSFSGSGDRDWTDVHNRIVTVSGVNILNFGDVTYAEDVEISDDDVNEMDAAFEKAGADHGAGRAVAMAARQMGYGVRFTARKADEKG